ncbi:MAG: GFA family protein [Sphingopyxis sp.]|nr:GFA family protein [Sphingopyxis sp.]
MTTGTALGSCLCGTVRFEVTGGFDAFFLCHCSRCRKNSGSAHGANLFAASATIDWLSGAEKVTSYHLPETQHARAFCKTCGSALPSLQMDGALLVVPAGSLDTPADIRPMAHICCASRADWDVDLSDIPHMDGLPG